MQKFLCGVDADGGSFDVTGCLDANITVKNAGKLTVNETIVHHRAETPDSITYAYSEFNGRNTGIELRYFEYRYPGRGQLLGQGKYICRLATLRYVNVTLLPGGRMYTQVYIRTFKCIHVFIHTYVRRVSVRAIACIRQNLQICCLCSGEDVVSENKCTKWQRHASLLRCSANLRPRLSGLAISVRRSIAGLLLR
jgi:hypothetical protein